MIVDLSQSLKTGMPVYPGDSDVSFSSLHSIDSTGYNVTDLRMNSHAGTHVDAPKHYHAEGIGVENQAVLEACIGSALVLDVRGSISSGEITLRSLGKQAESICHGDRLLLFTGWARHFGNAEYYSSHPSLSHELADFLIRRELTLLGVDMPSLSSTHSDEIHSSMLSAGIIIVENLCNLDHIVGQRVYFSATPLKLDGLDGSPVRAFAITAEVFD